MLELPYVDLMLERDVLLDIDVCDWLFHHDRDNHDAPLGDAVYVKKQKNDQRRQGMVKRFAFGSAENTAYRGG